MIVHSTSKNHFYELPAGKPDPDTPYTLDGYYRRARVLQGPQKELHCWYYAMNMLRQRVGKNGPPELQVQRVFEIKASSWRKKQTEHDAKIRQREGDLALGYQQMGRAIPAQAREDLKTKKFMPEFVELLEVFAAQEVYQDIFDFVQFRYALATIKTSRAFLTSIEGYSIERLSLQGCDPQQQKMILLNACFQACVSQYGFRLPDWHPSKGSFDEFMTSLKTAGPHLVKGFFGRQYCRKGPEEFKELEGFQAYCWKGVKEEDRINRRMTHSIVVVGAEKNSRAKGGGVVYFLDPYDPSDPAKPHQRPIYTLSYDRFLKDIVSYTGKAQIDGSFIDEEPYAIIHLNPLQSVNK